MRVKTLPDCVFHIAGGGIITLPSGVHFTLKGDGSFRDADGTLAISKDVVMSHPGKFLREDHWKDEKYFKCRQGSSHTTEEKIYPILYTTDESAFFVNDCGQIVSFDFGSLMGGASVSASQAEYDAQREAETSKTIKKYSDIVVSRAEKGASKLYQGPLIPVTLVLTILEDLIKEIKQ